jgi:hypothetical protein
MGKCDKLKLPGPVYVHVRAMCGEYFAACALTDPPPGQEQVEIMWVDFLRTLQRAREADDEATAHSVLEAFLLGVAMARERERDPGFGKTIRKWSRLTLRRRVEGFPVSWAPPSTSRESGQ